METIILTMIVAILLIVAFMYSDLYENHNEIIYSERRIRECVCIH